MISERLFKGDYQKITTSTTVVINPKAGRVVEVNPTAAAQSIKLPYAPELMLGGPQVMILNGNAYTVGVKDYLGNTVFTVPKNSFTCFYLMNRSTVGGTWKFFARGS
jgi:hypothetical protein